jgi:hypothetical protein
MLTFSKFYEANPLHSNLILHSYMFRNAIFNALIALVGSPRPKVYIHIAGRFMAFLVWNITSLTPLHVRLA